MAKEVDLLSYWMPILKQLKEFKEIAKAEEQELRYILEECDRTLRNMFISTADEYGVSRFERMMGIFPDEEVDLETRRFNVLVKWNDKSQYTDGELYKKLSAFCGEGNFSITEHYNDYWIEIVTYLGVRGAFESVVPSLQEMLPCNLVLKISNIVKEVSEYTPKVVGITSTAMSYTITDDLKT